MRNIIAPLLLTLSVSATLLAAPIGHIAGVRKGTGVVHSLQTGTDIPLPHARRPDTVMLSPDSTWALYFASTRPSPSSDGDDGPYAGYASRSPFTSAIKMPSPLASTAPVSATWLPGPAAALEGYNIHVLYSPARNTSTSGMSPVDAASSDGSVTAYTTDTAILVRTRSHTAPKIIFNILHPLPLVAALKRAHFSRNENGFEYDDAMAKDRQNWMFTNPILSSDGKTLYFCTNGGSGEGAQGNTSFFVVRADVASGTLRVLDKLGLFFGRSPSTFELSPDQKRVLISTSAHASAADNSFVVTASDLVSGHMVNLLADHKDKKAYANLVKGACWSPDSRYIAVAIFYYNPDTADAAELYDKSIPHLEIKDAATGKTVQTLKDFAWPSWGR